MGVDPSLPVAVFPHPVRTEWKMLAQLRIDNPSITAEECAKQLNVSPATIRYWTKKPVYQSFENWLLKKQDFELPLEVKRMRQDFKEELDEFAWEMLFRLKDIAETSHDNKLVAQIAFDAMDRAGYSEPKRDAARPITLIITPEVAQELARRTREIEAIEGVVVGQQ